MDGWGAAGESGSADLFRWGAREGTDFLPLMRLAQERESSSADLFGRTREKILIFTAEGRYFSRKGERLPWELRRVTEK